MARGESVVARPCGIEGEVCPMQAVCMEKVGGWGLMWYPWDEGPIHELGITRQQVWNFISGFDGVELGQYKASSTTEDLDFCEMGKSVRAELGIQ